MRSFASIFIHHDNAVGERGQEPWMRLAQLHPKGLHGRPQKLIKDQNGIPHLYIKSRTP
jgi:hypothetical protein